MGKSKPYEVVELGHNYGKPDTERLGLFSEMPYMNGKGYVSPFPKPKYEKERNLLAEGPKIKTAKQDCYFEKTFNRLFTGEAIAGRGRKEKPSPYKNVSERPMIPIGETKKQSSSGDYYGTFGGNIEAFSNKNRPKPPYKREPPNFTTSPGKKGGPGYANTGINPYPEHKPDRYGSKAKYKEYGHLLNGPFVATHYPRPFFGPNPYVEPPKMKPGPTYIRPKEKQVPSAAAEKFIPTGPAKWQGGCHAGCFDKFPEHKPDKYKSQYEINEKPPKNTGGNFYPQSSGQKSFYTTSILSRNTNFRVNVTNFTKYQPSYVKNLANL